MGLTETVAALRAELAAAVVAGADQEIPFSVGPTSARWPVFSDEL
jgi:hypothetical protein